MPEIRYSRCVYLSHVIDERIPVWPGDPPIELRTVATIAEHGYFLRRLSMGEHSGTHWNAPRTFFEEGPDAGAFPAESLIVPAVVIDARKEAARHANYQLSVADITAWEAAHGPIAAGSMVVLHTGWGECWHDPPHFLNADATGLHFPGFSTAATEFLLNERGIRGVGIDTHGADGGQDQTFATNRAVLARGGLVLENLANLDQLPPTSATLIIGILRLREGSGSPAAVLALVP